MLLGFHSWSKFKIYVKDLFPDVNVNLKGKLALGGPKGKTIVVIPKDLTKFEQCVICKLFFRSFPHRGKLATMFGVHETTIGRAIQEWGPRWGSAKEQLSILIITPSYLQNERPEEYLAQGFDKPGALKDGKDFVMHSKCTDGTLQRLQQSSKVHDAAGQCLSYSMLAGLAFENTAMYAAQYSENKLVHLYGSIGKKARKPQCRTGKTLLEQYQTRMITMY